MADPVLVKVILTNFSSNTVFPHIASSSFRPGPATLLLPWSWRQGGILVLKSYSTQFFLHWFKVLRGQVLLPSSSPEACGRRWRTLCWWKIMLRKSHSPQPWPCDQIYFAFCRSCIWEDIQPTGLNLSRCIYFYPFNATVANIVGSFTQSINILKRWWH